MNNNVPRRPTDRKRTRSALLQHVRNLDNRMQWEEFHNTYSDLIFFTARRKGVPASDAEDVVQEVFIDLARLMPDFTYDRQLGSFRGWLLKLVRWRINDHFRKARLPNVSAGQSEDAGGGEEVPVWEKVRDTGIEREMEDYWNEEWRRVVVGRALRNIQRSTKITERNLQILELRFARELAPAEVAKRIGIKRSLVDTVCSRSRPLLEQELDRLRDVPV